MEQPKQYTQEEAVSPKKPHTAKNFLRGIFIGTLFGIMSIMSVYILTMFFAFGLIPGNFSMHISYILISPFGLFCLWFISLCLLTIILKKLKRKQEFKGVGFRDAGAILGFIITTIPVFALFSSTV